MKHLFLVCYMYVTREGSDQQADWMVVVVALLLYVHGKHLRSCRDGQLT